MLEEIWEAEEDTPPGGLIFTGAKEGLNCTALFQMCNLNLSVFLQRQNYRANGCTAVFRSSGIALDAPTSLVICS